MTGALRLSTARDAKRVVVQCSRSALADKGRRTMDKQDKSPSGQPRFRSLGDVAFDAIEEMIVTRRLAPGAMLSESEIAAELSMGRTAVREALARLEWIGFVEVHPRRGVQVSTVDVIRHLELLEVRRPLEASMVRHVVERATPENLEDIQR